jgi:apolipoprotein N-acyltransferase
MGVPLRAAMRALQAFLLGIGAVLALPPVHALPALFAFAGLLLLLRRAESRYGAFAIGWCFGFGWFLAGLYWVGIAFHTDPERFGALAVPAVLLLAAGLALLPGLVGLAVVWRDWTSSRAQVLVFAAAWILAEVLRGRHGLGFPWNPVALAWADSPAMLQVIAWIGQSGLGLVTLIAATMPAILVKGHGRRRWRPPLLALLMLGLVYLAGWARLLTAEEIADRPVQLRIVQANVAQELKWDQAHRMEWFRRHLEMSQQSGTLPADVLIWPESAVPFPLAEDVAAREAVASVSPPAGAVLTGGNRYLLDEEPPVATNSLFVVDAGGAIRARYDKVDLVPFGEFLPFRPLLSLLGLGKVTEGTIDFVAGPGRRVLVAPGVPPFSPLICYEAIFPLAATPDEPRPEWLLNITNDAWFGRSSGPYQHLAMARLRAIEEGLPLVRAANSGISAVVDPHGRVRQSLPLDSQGVIDAALPGALPAPPPIRRLGHVITPVLLLLVLGAGVALEARARSLAGQAWPEARPRSGEP